MKLLIIGINHPAHIGSYFACAARQLGICYQIIDSSNAQANSRVVRAVYWRLMDRRPARLDQFGAEILQACAAMQCTVVLTTGCAPLPRSHIETLRRNGVRVMNYSTDDPWNSTQRASWFLSALPAYDAIFTPRRANLDDFRKLGVRSVGYLPFAYDPEVHRPCLEYESVGAASDVLFVGGCDTDRLPLIDALIESGLNLALFGGYWDRHAKTRSHWRGIADQGTIRSASAAARICLCLVRRANRDGNTMRSFEAAAIGGCILAEDTVDHRELFGPDDHAVRYFTTAAELVQRTKILLADAEARRRLTLQLRKGLGQGRNTYADRLASMLNLGQFGACAPKSFSKLR